MKNLIKQTLTVAALLVITTFSKAQGQFTTNEVRQFMSRGRANVLK